MSATRVALAGSTGSIGTQALDVLEAEAGPVRADRHRGHRSPAPRCSSTRPARHRPKVVAVADEPPPPWRRRRALPECEVRGGPDALASLATEADVVVNGVVGFAGLAGHPRHPRGRPPPGAWPTRNRSSPPARSCSGPAARRAPSWCRSTASTAPSTSACGPTTTRDRVARLLLTASGGPVPGPHRPPSWPPSPSTRPWPTRPGAWAPRSPIDSSTLMNKGLEVIEAHELFGAPAGDAGYGIGFDRDRRGGAPAVDRALDGRVHRRLHHRPALQPRHAPPHRLRPGLARPHRHPVRSHRLEPARPARLRATRP